MPYSFAFVDVDDDKEFSNDGIDTVSGKTTVYTNEAVTEGEKFKDEDFILGYFNKDANYIKVAKVCLLYTSDRWHKGKNRCGYRMFFRT